MCTVLGVGILGDRDGYVDNEIYVQKREDFIIDLYFMVILEVRVEGLGSELGASTRGRHAHSLVDGSLNLRRSSPRDR